MATIRRQTRGPVLCADSLTANLSLVCYSHFRPADKVSIPLADGRQCIRRPLKKRRSAISGSSMCRYNITSHMPYLLRRRALPTTDIHVDPLPSPPPPPCHCSLIALGTLVEVVVPGRLLPSRRARSGRQNCRERPVKPRSRQKFGVLAPRRRRKRAAMSICSLRLMKGGRHIAKECANPLIKMQSRNLIQTRLEAGSQRRSKTDDRAATDRAQV